MTLYILANPQAGSATARTIIKAIHEQYPDIPLEIHLTEKKDQEAILVERILKTFDSNIDQLLILGGDGTLSKTLDYWPAQLPFAYYPTGSGNDFAHALLIRDLDKVMTAMQVKRSQKMFVMQTNNGTILNSLDIGFAAKVIASSEQSSVKGFLKKLGLGKLTYLFFALKHLGHVSEEELEITLDETTYQWQSSFFLSIAKNKYFGGGITIWPDTSFQKPIIDLVYIPRKHFWSHLRGLLDLVLKYHKRSKVVRHLETHKVRIHSSKPFTYQYDGEVSQANDLTLYCQERYIYY